MVTGCLFTGGKGPSSRRAASYIRDAGITAAADSGLLLAEKLGVVPDYIVGDFDSLPDQDILKKYPPLRIVRHPRDKDHTDTELGVGLLREKGCRRIVILGGGGGRLDHILAVHSLFIRTDPPDLWLTDREEAALVRSVYVLRGWKGRTVSFFPLGGGPVRMRSWGLKWPLDELVWRPGDFGISNVAADDTVRVEVSGGSLLAIRAWERG